MKNDSIATTEVAPPAAGYGSCFMRWMLVFLLFFTYPIAVFAPVTLGIPLQFHFSLPSFFWLTLGTLVAFLLLSLQKKGSAAAQSGRLQFFLWQYSRGLIYGVLAAAAAGAIMGGLIYQTAALSDVVIWIGYFSIPLFFATCPRAFLPKRLALILALLWFLNVMHGYWQIFAGFEHGVVGLTGNRNWMSTLNVALAPWLILAAHEKLKRLSRKLIWRRIISATAILLVAMATLFLTVKGNSRGTWLMLAVYIFCFLLLPQFSRLMRVILIVLTLASACMIPLFYPQPLVRAIEDDIRLPLYAGTVAMIADHPLLGVGPGNYRRQFVTYRSHAHKQRRVAAPVTAHPHNEWLHVASSLGIPLAVVWLVLLLPLLHRPPKTSLWRCIHFSAFMIIGHGMLDKLLVQPPVNILGFFFLGLLWRPLLPARLAFRAAITPQRRYISVLVITLASVIGVLAGGRHMLTRWLFREAYIAEIKEEYDNAYHIYAKAATVAANEVHAHTFAGVAANRLRHFEQALQHLQQAYIQDPNFARINGEIGYAMGGLNRHEQAWLFFLRETQLYPFDVLAHQRLFLCGLITGRHRQLQPVFERLQALHYRRLSQNLAEQEVRLHSQQFLLALQHSEAFAAVTNAAALLSRFQEATAEPAYMRMAKETDLPPQLFAKQVTEAEFDYWRKLMQWRQLARAHTGKPVTELFRWFVEEHMQELQSEKALYDFAEFAYQCGLEAALLKVDGNTVGMLELRDGKGQWLLSLHQEIIFRGNSASDLLNNAELQKVFALADVELDNLELVLPITPFAFWSRTQALGAILRKAAGPAAPLFGDSPSLRLNDYRTLLSLEHHSPLPISFDAKLFHQMQQLQELSPHEEP